MIPDITITPFKILLSVFVIFAWSRAFFRFREKTIGFGGLFVWTLLWAGAFVAIYVPGKTDFLAKLLGVNRGADAVFTLSIIILFYAAYRFYAQLNRLRKDLTTLVQRLARQRTEKDRDRS